MKIGIMGGTFNPIHNAHLLIAEMAREEYGLDRVIFITDGNPPHKSANVTAKQRFEMTHIAIADNSAFEEDDFEINRSEKSYTVNTLGYLKEKYPNDDLFFIIGEDSLNDFDKWYKPDKILEIFCTFQTIYGQSEGTLNFSVPFLLFFFTYTYSRKCSF